MLLTFRSLNRRLIATIQSQDEKWYHVTNVARWNNGRWQPVTRTAKVSRKITHVLHFGAK
jgi:hypothetical protein